MLDQMVQRLAVPSGVHGAAVQDSVVVESPLPGGVSALVRFLFQVPQWIQIGGLLLGIAVAGIVVWYLYQRRRPIWSWITTRDRAWKMGMLAGVAVLLIGSAGFGMVSWNYMQHDNGFCTGCHVMEGAFQRFTSSEHDSLSCHDCHQQPMTASMRQLYLWVAERPEEIGPHSPVPNAVCETCHVTGEPDVWQRIASTAGHRTHLESTDPDLSDVMCVTCHGQEVHRFAPVSQTCSQSGCHVDVDIAIGAMAEQTSLHCVTCHEFTAEVPALATTDSAMGTMRPALAQCTGCHEMREVLGDFDANADPHNATCGMCHNPHTQSTAEEAEQTCTSAGCHDTWRNEPFHVGASHRRVGSDCQLCHEPHSASVDASDCVACHAAIVERDDVPAQVRNRLQRAMPFDTSRARGSANPAGGPDAGPTADVHGAAPAPRLPLRMFWGAGAPPQELGRSPPVPSALFHVPSPTPQDTFPHDRHTELTCITCHTTSSGEGALTFEQPRGCQLCHHGVGQDAECENCHTANQLAAPRMATVTIEVRDAPRRTRGVDLLHGDHADVTCETCHSARPTMAVASDMADCVACHDDHHGPDRACSGCHVPVQPDGVHGPPAEAHRACASCHQMETVGRLYPDRALCLTCHGDQADHYADPMRECTTCHFLADPAVYHAVLVGTDR